FVASCTVSIDQDQVETCSGPEAADSLTFGALGESGTREFFTHVRFHKHDEERIVVHLLVELYARSEQEAIDVLEGSARATLEITSLAEESRPSASALNTRARRRVPLSKRTAISPATASATAGRASREAIAPSTWRPPWLETTSPSTPRSRASSASSGCRMPLTRTGNDVHSRRRP